MQEDRFIRCTQNKGFPERNGGVLQLCQAGVGGRHCATRKPCPVLPDSSPCARHADKPPTKQTQRDNRDFLTLPFQLGPGRAPTSRCPSLAALGVQAAAELLALLAGRLPGSSTYRLCLLQVLAPPLLLPEGLIRRRLYAPQALRPFAVDHKELLFAVVKGIV